MTRIKGQKPLTHDEKQQIASRYESGDTFETLQREFRRGKPAIKAALDEFNVAVRRRGYPTGTKWTDEWREAHKRGTSTSEFREASRQNLLKRLLSMRGPATNSPIERRMHDALKKVGIGFTTQKLLLGRHLVDIILHQQPIVIEADGSQHYLRDHKLKDAQRNAELLQAGYRVFLFTGSEINSNAMKCVQRVINECDLKPDEDPQYEIRTGFTGENHPNWKGGQRDFTCEACGTTFRAQPAHRAGPHIYCTRKCANGARRKTRS